MRTYNNTDELYHYGVLGMKWGHRKKYYNSDGSLNDTGKQKVSKKYYNYMVLANSRIDRQKVFAKSAKKAQKQTNKAGYLKGTSDYEKNLYKNAQKNFNDNIYKSYKNNRYYKKAEKLADKYKMEDFNDLVKKNRKFIKLAKNNKFAQVDKNGNMYFKM